jgi:hypothetical protein
LWYGGQIVKKCPRSARNLILILQAFQEEGWKSRIDDPLPPSKGKDPSGRLRDAVRGLNAIQSVLLFRADGAGEGVLWGLRGPARTSTELPRKNPCERGEALP